jgi:hypothetical protein
MRSKLLRRLQLHEILKPFCAWAPADNFKRTLSEYVRGRVSDSVRQYWKFCFPACNVKRSNEAVATDTVFNHTPAVFTGGIKDAQIFIGSKSLVADNIRKQGAMD